MAMTNRARLTATLTAALATATIATATLTTRNPPPPPTFSPLCAWDAKSGLICDTAAGQTLTLTTKTATQTATGQLARRGAHWPAPAITPPATITLTATSGQITHTIPLITAWRPMPGAPITITASHAPTRALAIHVLAHRDAPTAALTITAHHIPITLPSQITLTTWRTSTLIIETHAGLITRHYARIHTLLFPIVRR